MPNQVAVEIVLSCDIVGYGPNRPEASGVYAKEHRLIRDKSTSWSGHWHVRGRVKRVFESSHARSSAHHQRRCT